MNLGELINTFRAAADDDALPYLWSDNELAEFANDAVMEAARRARLLVDARTVEVCRAPLVALDPWVTIDSRVIFVRRAVVVGRSAPLQKTQERTLDQCVPGWESSVASSPSHFMHSPPGALRLWPPPAEDGVLQMTVVREPLNPMVSSSDEPEIPTRYHRSLVEWMLFRAWTKPDSDAMDKERAATAEMRFEQEFGKRSSAQEERWAQEHYGMDTFEGQY